MKRLISLTERYSHGRTGGEKGEEGKEKNMMEEEEKRKCEVVGCENEAVQSVHLTVWRWEKDEKNHKIRKTRQPDFFTGFRHWKQREGPVIGRNVCDFHWKKVKKALETIDEIETEREAHNRYYGKKYI
jgi:hypothetical protein